ncbi:MAG: type II toxin-antitoxin system VapC family toxin [Deltaproteobacteria bacterium]|nr:type II toxin-antitoxin system VapC family toxin [Deltaproteobacteria bacterium]
MNGRFLLDTNIVVALFAEDSSVQQGLLKAEQVFVPSIVLGELYYGAQKSLRKEENIARVDEFAAASSVLGPSVATAKEYGEIKNALFNQGHPIPDNDIWIAALTKQYGVTLVTRDEHFKEVEGITIETW